MKSLFFRLVVLYVSIITIRSDGSESTHTCDLSCTHFQDGLKAAKNQDWRRAITEFSAVIESRTDAASLCAAHINRGRAHLMIGNAEAALTDFNDAIAADPKSADAYSWRASYWSDKGDKYKTIADCTTAISIDSGWIPAYVRRATAYGSLKQYPLAYDDYSVALELDPQNFAALVGRALVREHLSDPSGALEDIEKAVLRRLAWGKLAG